MFRRKKVKIGEPQNALHITHVTYDAETQQCDGLPPQWYSQLRASGAIDKNSIFRDPLGSRGRSSNATEEIANLLESTLVLDWTWEKQAVRRSPNKDAASARVFETAPNKFRTNDPFAIQKNPSASLPKGSNELPPHPDTQNDVPVLKIERNSKEGSAPTAPQSAGSLEELHLQTERTEPSIEVSGYRTDAGEAHPSEERPQSDDAVRFALRFGLTVRHQDFNKINHGLLQVVDSLGHGSLGVVEEVRVSPKHKSFVRKRVQIPYHHRKRYLNIIREEAQVLGNLSHCHIVQMLGTYHEAPSSGRQFYSILMAPVGQRDLKIFLEMISDKGTARPEDLKLEQVWAQEREWLWKWFRCLSSALEYIHSKGVRHQDIKPSNIIHREDAIFFTDFGSAAEFQIGQTTSTENPARTSATYAAPEVIDTDNHLRRHGRGTDIFSAGAVFTEMLAVLRGKTVEEYHQFLLNSSEGDGTKPASRQSLLYGRKAKHIDAFFGDDVFYRTYIRSMLNADRAQRPNARQVATHIRGWEPWTLRNCACDVENVERRRLERKT